MGFWWGTGLEPILGISLNPVDAVSYALGDSIVGAKSQIGSILEAMGRNGTRALIVRFKDPLFPWPSYRALSTRVLSTRALIVGFKDPLSPWLSYQYTG
jgi:hypothetical protein